MCPLSIRTATIHRRLLLPRWPTGLPAARFPALPACPLPAVLRHPPRRRRSVRGGAENSRHVTVRLGHGTRGSGHGIRDLLLPSNSRLPNSEHRTVRSGHEIRDPGHGVRDSRFVPGTAWEFRIPNPGFRIPNAGFLIPFRPFLALNRDSLPQACASRGPGPVARRWRLVSRGPCPV